MLTQGLPWRHQRIEALMPPRAGALWTALVPGRADARVDVVAGVLVLLGVSAVSRWRGAARSGQ